MPHVWSSHVEWCWRVRHWSQFALVSTQYARKLMDFWLELLKDHSRLQLACFQSGGHIFWKWIHSRPLKFEHRQLAQLLQDSLWFIPSFYTFKKSVNGISVDIRVIWSRLWIWCFHKLSKWVKVGQPFWLSMSWSGDAVTTFPCSTICPDPLQSFQKFIRVLFSPAFPLRVTDMPV